MTSKVVLWPPYSCTHMYLSMRARTHTHIKSGGGVRKSIQDCGYSYSTYELSLYPRYNLAFSSGSVLL